MINATVYQQYIIHLICYIILYIYTYITIYIYIYIYIQCTVQNIDKHNIRNIIHGLSNII